MLGLFGELPPYDMLSLPLARATHVPSHACSHALPVPCVEEQRSLENLPGPRRLTQVCTGSQFDLYVIEAFSYVLKETMHLCFLPNAKEGLLNPLPRLIENRHFDIYYR